MMSGLEIFEHPLENEKIYQKWLDFAKANNLGASSIFVGIVREENHCEGLSFDIYEPLLQQWFAEWSKKALEINVFLKMAHAKGNVYNHQSSYMSGCFSSQRKACLSLFEDFIEDFKHKAPIWKYDLKDGQRIYAKERSHKLPFSGILR